MTVRTPHSTPWAWPDLRGWNLYFLSKLVLAWMGAQWLGGRLGWEPRYAFLLDLAALAAFFWALVVTYQIWRRHKAAHRGN